MILTIKAGETRNVPVAGDSFYLIDAQGKIAVKTRTQGDTRTYDLSAGMGVRAFDADTFTGFDLTEKSGFDQVIEFEIADKEVFDNRAVGVVKVVNADKSRVDLRQAFMIAGKWGPSAGLVAAMALRNPTGSTKKLYVNQVVMSVPTLSECGIYLTPSVDADYVVAGVSGLIQSNPGTSVGKKVDSSMMGGSTGIDFLYADVLPKGGMKIVSRVYVGAGAQFIYKFTEPVMLSPGSAMVVGNLTVNTSLNVNFEYFEEII